MNLAALLEAAGPIGIGIAIVVYLVIADFIYPKIRNDRDKKNGTVHGYLYNPSPPGGSKTCRENRDMIVKATGSIRDIERRLGVIEDRI